MRVLSVVCVNHNSGVGANRLRREEQVVFDGGVDADLFLSLSLRLSISHFACWAVAVALLSEKPTKGNCGIVDRLCSAHVVCVFSIIPWQCCSTCKDPTAEAIPLRSIEILRYL
mmetsp:Transcript_700/g.1582  ORF Transcript_700/g.1582 Transcript_700/m.1582 type:complete len:114 (+) Transcript_700:2529-2870(+)